MFDYLRHLIREIELIVVDIFIAVTTIIVLFQVIKNKVKK